MRLYVMGNGVGRSGRWSPAPGSMTWRAVEARAAATTMMFRKSDGVFWLLTLIAIAGLTLAFYMS